MEYVGKIDELVRNVRQFANELEVASSEERKAMLKLFRTYVVYLPATGEFAPVKYAAVRDISFPTYRALSAAHEGHSQSRFNSSGMQKHVLNVTGSCSAFVPAEPYIRCIFIAFLERYSALTGSPAKADKLRVLQLDFGLSSLSDTSQSAIASSPFDGGSNSQRPLVTIDSTTRSATPSLIEEDAATRRCIELYAMRAAERLLRQQGGHVVDVSAKRSWDLEWTHDGTRTLVEVKGTRGTGQKLILTYNEAHLTPSIGQDRALVVVAEIELQDGDDGGLIASGGYSELVYPWEVEMSDLRPLSYEYCRPRG